MDQEAELVYRTMLQNPAWGVAHVAGHLAWSQGRTRRALDALADLRLVQPGRGEAGRARPVSPHIGLTALLVRAEVECHRQQSQIAASRAAVEALASQYGASADHAPEVIIRHDGPEALRRRLGDLASSARVSCLTLQPGAVDAPGDGGRCAPVARIAAERGLAVREVRQDNVRGDAATRACVRALEGLGVQVRTVPVLPIRLALFDGDCALVPSDPGNCRAGALELRSPGAVAAVRALFEQFWGAGTSWETFPRPDANGLQPRERELLKLLADGHTDETVSRRLGLSSRTVRRLAADLMGRLEAASRFQAGVNAAKRGWL
ncbi:helix-turn-helix transcriptional regulator [Streptomyces beijiangensis]|uniref:LuxR family transcriptional regulator n=1 Tax=Streptomyces beijiangensis TaxID=163361 RepID=A0A939FDT1_9ACTN|nr:LuxR C-terminal-related transcriptional regulator [Streptomyces beijiangensis]MBO0516479.1 LuxR family transcriptional regulator [Streptomyces beijiangensis]